jgi:hypothetical protein
METWIAVIPAHIISDTTLSSSAKVVYGAISSFTANGKKPGFPSLAEIAKRAGLSVRTVPRLISQVSQAGHIKIRPRAHGRSHVYELSAPKCDDIEKSQRIPASNLNARMSTRSIKRIEKRNSTHFPEQAEALYTYYATNVRPGPRTVTLKFITKLLTQHGFEELMATVAAYMASREWHTDMEFRFAAHNFFGKREYFRDYLKQQSDHRPAELPPKALTPAELEIWQKLIDAGQD